MFTPMRTRLSSILLLVALLAACGGDNGDSSAAPGAPPEPVICPLTGVETSDDFPIDRPVLAVKIDNAAPARPQVGLDAADIIYEELGEGGLSRFLALYHCSDADVVGPVRSARNTDVDLLREFDSVLFGYSGANNEVLASVAAASWIVDLKHGTNGDAYTRASDRSAPYNLMSSTERLRTSEAAGDAQGPPSTSLVFNSEVLEPAEEPSPAEGEAQPPVAAPAAGNTVSFSFSDRNVVRYSYDQAGRDYLRFHGDTPHNLAGGGQVRAVNLVIQKVRIVPGSVLDASGSPTQDSVLTGTGEVTVLRGGQSITGTWSRPGPDDQTEFRDAEGRPIELAPGNTFIHLIPQQRTVTVG